LHCIKIHIEQATTVNLVLIFTFTGQTQKDAMNSNILLVDDNAVQAATRKSILERAGFVVSVASNGQAALELLSEPESSQGDPPGLMLTDHLMPGMNGPELVREVRERGFDFPIIVLSGLPDAETSYEELGVVFRLKPFPPDSLISLSRSLLCEPMPRTA
jgi:CheY-like chemotaxis protein